MIDSELQAEFQIAVDSNDVLLFMKGTPQFPQCGFSSTVVQMGSSASSKIP